MAKELKELTKRSENYSQWYNDLVVKADLAEQSPVRGCMVIKPYGYAIWEKMQRVLDDKFKETRLTPLPGSQVAAPLVAECPLGLECKVAQTVELGSHTLFLAEIVAVQVSEEFVNASGRLELEKAGLAAYIHGHYHRVGDAIGHFGYSVRKKPGPVVRR